MSLEYSYISIFRELGYIIIFREQGYISIFREQGYISIFRGQGYICKYFLEEWLSALTKLTGLFDQCKIL